MVEYYSPYDDPQSQKMRLDKEKFLLQKSMAQARQIQAEQHMSERLAREERREALIREQNNIKEQQARFSAETNMNIARMEGEYSLKRTQMQGENAYEIASSRNRTDLDIAKSRNKTDLEVTKLQSMASMRLEEISGGNQRELSILNFALDNASKSSDLINDLFRSEIKKQEDWDNVHNNLISQLVLMSANVEAQKSLKKMESKQQKKMEKMLHRQAKEKMSLEHNFKVLEMCLSNQLQDWRVTHDKACEVIFRMVEKMLGLGEHQVSEAEISQYVQEAITMAKGDY